jgi:hypothetical protein
MRTGYRTTGELLNKDLQREESLAAALADLARQVEPDLEKLLLEVARRCSRNGEKVAQLLAQLAAPEYEVSLRCPVCGWAIPYGRDPVPGTEIKCELCSIWFRLVEEDGDYGLQNIGRKGAKGR